MLLSFRRNGLPKVEALFGHQILSSMLQRPCINRNQEEIVDIPPIPD
jgi:hypothetical protein